MDLKFFDCGKGGITTLSTIKKPAKKITIGKYLLKVLITDFVINTGFKPLIESCKKPDNNAMGKNNSPIVVSSQEIRPVFAVKIQ
jgi:hypothetical protein